METTVAIAWIAGIVLGVLFGAFFGFAYGLQAGKKKRIGTTPTYYLGRDDVLSLVAHRLQQIVRIVRDRIPASKRRLEPSFTDQQLVDQSEFCGEYSRLSGAFSALRRPEVESAVRHVTAIDLAIPLDQRSV